MPLRDVLTASWLQDRYLVGIDLTTDDGTAYPDAIYTQSILNAVSALETELDITLNGIQLEENERHDRLDMDEEGYFYHRLRKRPVRGLTKLQWKFGNFEGSALPKSWHERVSALMGDVRVVPSGDSLETSVIGSFHYYYFSNGVHHLTPGWWLRSYRHGYDDRRDAVALGTFSERFYLNGPLYVEPSVAPSSGQTFTVTVAGNLLDTDQIDGVGSADTEVLTWSTADGSYAKKTSKSWARITSVTLAESGSDAPEFRLYGDLSWPQVFEDAIGLTASLLLLDTAGDLIVGAGIASKSISMDGLSQSINTTSSATNAGYGARVLSYGKRLKGIMDGLKGQLDRREVFAV